MPARASCLLRSLYRHRYRPGRSRIPRRDGGDRCGPAGRGFGLEGPASALVPVRTGQASPWPPAHRRPGFGDASGDRGFGGRGGSARRGRCRSSRWDRARRGRHRSSQRDGARLARRDRCWASGDGDPDRLLRRISRRRRGNSSTCSCSACPRRIVTGYRPASNSAARPGTGPRPHCARGTSCSCGGLGDGSALVALLTDGELADAEPPRGGAGPSRTPGPAGTRWTSRGVSSRMPAMRCGPGASPTGTGSCWTARRSSARWKVRWPRSNPGTPRPPEPAVPLPPPTGRPEQDPGQAALTSPRFAWRRRSRQRGSRQPAAGRRRNEPLSRAGPFLRAGRGQGAAGPDRSRLPRCPGQAPTAGFAPRPVLPWCATRPNGRSIERPRRGAQDGTRHSTCARSIHSPVLRLTRARRRHLLRRRRHLSRRCRIPR